MTALVSVNLPLIAGAPKGIKKLRELILELAVRGKLVPQDPNDEPASELLKRIAEEKARLIAEGKSKIKKQKPLAKIESAEKLFELPVGWEWTRLGEITNFGTTTKRESIPDDAWVLDLEDIEKDTSRLLKRARFSERNSLSDKNSFSKGDVLYGKLRPYLNKVLVADSNGFCTTEILPFRCYGPFDAHYFKIALKSPYFLLYVNAKSYGMKMPRLGTEDGRQALFPLPPFAEQNRIVAKVDELMALCDRLEAQQADAESAHARLIQALLDSLTHASDATDFAASWQRLTEHFHTLFSSESSIDALKQTLLQLAVMGKLVPQDSSDEPVSKLLERVNNERKRLEVEGLCKKAKALDPLHEDEKPFKLPASWEWIRLGTICSKVTDGEHATPRRTSSGYYLLSARNVTNEGILLGDVDFVPPDEFERIRKRCDPNIGDVLISCSGSVGRVALVDRDNAYVMVRSAAMVRPISVGLTPEFIAQSLRSPTMQAEIFSKSRQSAQANLFLGAISSLVIPVAPQAEQHRIVAKVNQLMDLCDRLKARLTQARQLNDQLASTLVEQALA